MISARSATSRTVYGVVVVAIVLAVVVITSYPPVSNPITHAFTGPLQISTFSSAVDNTQLGLSLGLRISTNSTGALLIYANDTNTRDATNNLTAADAWMYPESRINYICGNFADYPLLSAVFKGNYGLNNLTTASALTSYNPNVTPSCPTMLEAPAYYVFDALSSTGTQYFLGNSYNDTISASFDSSWTGYWTGSGATAAFRHFASGSYTVMVEDEWGNVVLLNFMPKTLI